MAKPKLTPDISAADLPTSGTEMPIDDTAAPPAATALAEILSPAQPAAEPPRLPMHGVRKITLAQARAHHRRR